MGDSYVYMTIDGKVYNYPQGVVKDFLSTLSTCEKAINNAAAQAVTLGLMGDDYCAFGKPSLHDQANGYDIISLPASIVSELGVTVALSVLSGGGAAVTKVSTGMRLVRGAAFVLSSGRNYYDMYRGAEQMIEAGHPTFQSSLRLFGGTISTRIFRGLSQNDGVLIKMASGAAGNVAKQSAKVIRKIAPKNAPKLFPNLKELQDPVHAHELMRINDTWKIKAGNEFRTAKGNYNFITTQDGRIFVHPSGGHTGISKGLDVLYAGKIRFGSGKNTKGIIQEWWNNSGHYRPIPDYAHQAGLPMDKFKAGDF